MKSFLEFIVEVKTHMGHRNGKWMRLNTADEKKRREYDDARIKSGDTVTINRGAHKGKKATVAYTVKDGFSKGMVVIHHPDVHKVHYNPSDLTKVVKK